MEFLKNKKLVMIERVAALGLALNNSIELFRLLPRYKAGLQGSLEMAKDRWDSIEKTGIDPFSQQTRETREINDQPEANFTQSVQPKPPVAPTSLIEQADKVAKPDSPMI